MVKLEPGYLTMIPLVEKPYEPFHIHIGMVLSILGPNPYGFFFELFPKMLHTNWMLSMLIYS